MSIHDDVVAQVGTCGNPACEVCSLAEEDLSDEALDPGAFDGEREAILRENAETRADLGLDTTPAGDTFDPETGEVLKDAPGWDKTTRTILNNEGCDWAGGRLREKQEAIDECHRMHDAEVKRVQARCDRLMAAAEARLAKATAPLHRDADFLENAIRAYAETHRADILRGLRKDAKSRRFPSGLRVAWKSGGGEYRWRKDMKPAEREAALLAWAKNRPGLTEVVEVPDLEAVKKHLAAADRVNPPGREPHTPAPGLEYVPEHEELVVKVEN